MKAPSDLSHPTREPLSQIVEALRRTGYAFTTITPRSHAIINARPENALARNLRDIFGWSRPFESCGLDPNLLRLMRAAGLATSLGGERLQATIRVSSLDDLLFVHSAFPTSANDAVFFGPDTYKFVAALQRMLARRAMPIRRAADVCTGAGPAAIVTARWAPDAEVLMVDINPKALLYAASNAASAGCKRARPVISDRLEQVEGLFDVITAHPPYLVDTDQRAYRHGGGLLGAELAVSIVRSALPRLAPGGTLLMLTGVAMPGARDPFRDAIAPLLEAEGCAWSYREVDPDVFGEELELPAYWEAERIALVVLEATKPGNMS